MEAKYIMINDDSCNGFEIEFRDWLRSKGHDARLRGEFGSSNKPYATHDEQNALWEEFCGEEIDRELSVDDEEE